MNFTRVRFLLLEGASLPEEIVARAADLGCPAIVIVDRNGFYGSARAHGVPKKRACWRSWGPRFSVEKGDVPVLCVDRRGYQILCRYLTTKNLQPLECQELIPDGHLVVLTGDREGPLCRAILRGDKPAAQALIRRFGTKRVL